jgi:phage shock protein PspC (stress-responsive transcriptional regulator)
LTLEVVEFIYCELTVNEEIKTPPVAESGPRRLKRSLVNRHIAGVCGGIAEYFNIDPLIVRLLWIVSFFIQGIGLFAYIAAWIIIPENRQQAAVSPAPKSQSSQYIWGIILILLGVFWLADKFDWYFLVPWRWHYMLPYWFNWGVFVSIFIILLGFLLIFRSTSGPPRPSGIVAPPAPAAGKTAEHISLYDEGERRMYEKRLTRAVDERMIGGVCGGLAKYLNIDPSLVRIGFVLLTIFSGILIGIVTYIVMMIVIPEETPAVKNPTSPAGNVG